MEKQLAFTPDEIADESIGVCLACWTVVEAVEPDARDLECECCGAHRVYGLEEALLMGEILVEE